ncbi:FKBP-type peptidyl-prolyl cis-trans isomerase [Nesterenkonia aerolata]|uniref:peptidylprolyl isomerase n=1 Tax=Nesterenkonia aerolata TaxID=3074079 RepID=A0ABU2DQ39_9MICC|nr:FKBP-type peptidyl-prolyl cis-trans isomerase [Nesterenkonia sp. LY-0111]MDR8018628.1 FKBP-type peptidyl-prolyl cis-trans isomerase [Nesterenkonia sp. LY-0111]
MRTKHLALSLPAVLVLAGCGAEGIGDVDALDGMDVHYTDEGAPEVMLNNPVEADEESARIISAGDGEEIDPEQILEVSSAMVDPQTGEVQNETFTAGQESLLHLPSIREQNEFIFEALTEPDLNVGGEVVLYEPGDEEAMAADSLIVLRVEGQMPAYAHGEELEQSGDLPEIDSVEGEAPELVEAPGEDEDPPEETVTEVIIEGEGDEVEAEDQLAVQYTGWTWSEGTVFDSSWPLGQEQAQQAQGSEEDSEEDPEEDSEEDAGESSEDEDAESTEDAEEEDQSERSDVGQPMPFMLDQVIEGWTTGLEGKHVGDRVVLVIPPSEAYGESDGSDLQEETLIFVVDIVAAVEAPEQPEQQAPEQPELSEEELEQLQEQLEQQEGGEAEEDTDEQ